VRLFRPPAVQARLQAQAGMGAGARRGGRWLARLLRLAVPLGKCRCRRRAGKRRRCASASCTRACARAAPLLFFAAKTVLAASLPALLFFLLLHARPGLGGLLLCLSMAAACGYYLPNLLLARWRSAASATSSRPFPTPWT
jgi:tight adherence protein C